MFWKLERVTLELLDDFNEPTCTPLDSPHKTPVRVAQRCRGLLISATLVGSPIREWRSETSPGDVITLPGANAALALLPPTVPSTFMNNSYAQEHMKGTCSQGFFFLFQIHKHCIYDCYFSTFTLF